MTSLSFYVWGVRKNGKKQWTVTEKMNATNLCNYHDHPSMTNNKIIRISSDST